MSASKHSQSLLNLEAALERLQEALQEPETNKLALDGTIQRFEFVIELFWKTLKRLLASEGVQTDTPREAIKHAFQLKWLADETAWLQMLKDRNETSHVYDEIAARRIYDHVKQYYPQLEATYKFLQQRFAGHR
jgi:nucleotidyltransferase substrate binding protein (TIGR01987 family)